MDFGFDQSHRPTHAIPREIPTPTAVLLAIHAEMARLS